MVRSEPRQVEVPVIAGYRDLVPISAGGFSTVYTAHQTALGRTVAVKVVHVRADDPHVRARFRNECEIVGALTGQPHVIAVFDAGSTVDGQPYIAMQYLPNGSLADRLAGAGPLSPGQVVHVGMGVAEALAAAHDARILHRDIKPGNILVSERGEPVLTDFGIAVLLDYALHVDAGEALTRAYTAPEVLAGQPASIQSDIYALAGTLYALLVGSPPVGDADAVTSGRHRTGTDPRLARLHRMRVPSNLLAWIRFALAADPHQRPVSAAECARDLAAAVGDNAHHTLVAASRHSSSQATGPSGIRLTTMPAEPASTPDPTDPTVLRLRSAGKPARFRVAAGRVMPFLAIKSMVRRHRLWSVMILIAAFVLAGVGITIAVARSRSHPTVAAPSATRNSVPSGTVTLPDPAVNSTHPPTTTPSPSSASTSPDPGPSIPVTGDGGPSSLPPSAPARAPTTCKAGDSSLRADRTLSQPVIGSEITATLCTDHVTTGDYWAVTVYDTAPDNKCAHAVVTWHNHNGNLYSDWGMWVCGYGASKTFYSSVRNWTLYYFTEAGTFIDNGPTSYGPVYRF